MRVALWFVFGLLGAGACAEERERAGPETSGGEEVTQGDGVTVDGVDPGDAEVHGPMDGHGPSFDLALGEAIFRDHCVACHTIGGGPRRGPDLAGIQQRRPQGWVGQWLRDPEGMATTDPIGQALRAEWPIQMPNPGLEPEQIRSVVQFIKSQSAVGPLVPRAPATLDAPAFERMTGLYFDRCAGCHGTLRGGGTGPELGAARARELGTDTLFATIKHGTPSGMPPWGKAGLVSPEDNELLAAFLQLDPPVPPELELTAMRAEWSLVVPVAARPSAPEHGRDWENFFGVVLRDAGAVAIFDGDTHERLATVETGYAVHILRASATGRYFYAVGRDGRVTLVDLWAQVPAVVARARGCFDARAVSPSKREGDLDRYLIEGCYWPPQYVVMDGLTLEPLAKVDVRGPAIGETEPLSEVRVAAIVASHDEPTWLIALKESGHVGVVDYSQPGFPLVARLPAERFLHDGGWDHTRRYFLLAANMRDRVVVVDAKARAVVTSFETGVKPHPGRGANWLDPELGWVNATPHIGEGLLAIYGADPVGHPEHAWKVVREVPLPSAGSLFIKTHDASPYVFIDMPMSGDLASAREMCAYDKELGALARCWSPSERGRVVHFELDRRGAELWVSVWDEAGAIVIYDATTLEELDRIEGLETPTGKFNVYNTAHDIY